MEPAQDYIKSLLHTYLQGKINTDGMEELFTYLREHQAEAETLLQEVSESYKDRMLNALPLPAATSERMLKGLLGKINEAQVVSIKRSVAWKRWIAAAAVILVLGSTVWWWMAGRDDTNNNKPAIADIQHTGNDALPGFDGAILTLADGKQLQLDSTANGNMQLPANAVKQGNQLVYANTSAENTPVTHNILATPKGRKYQLTLADGTKVWLDAASSIAYPTVFRGTERKVKIAGQVYFEVAKDPSRPFIVETRNTNIEVLGTHFNVNAYDDEDAMKTTLLEGSVKLKSINSANRSTGDEVILKPGEQAQIGANPDQPGQVRVIRNTDIEQVMAWKNGLFNFNHTDLATVMRQLARWYDLDIRYEGPVPAQTFGGKITRDLNLLQVLKLLERVEVKFRLEGKTLIVTS